MTCNDIVLNDYFEWLANLVGDSGNRPKDISFRKLLMHLHSVDFIYTIPMDRNRHADGLDLRYRFSLLNDYGDGFDYDGDKCSVLEMMIALAIRCEEDITDNTNYGDRTSQWFWGMIRSLGLNSMTDAVYDREYVDEVITRFLNREYDPDGKGGLFRIKGIDRDLRKVEIWYQLNWYLQTIV
jgi:hypothetical protein